MTQKLTIRKGGASGATIQDFSAMIRLFDATGDRAIFGGMKFNNGDSASSQAILLDEDSVVPNGDVNNLTIYGFNEVVWSDDSPGYDAWLSVGRVSNKDWARPAPRTAGVTRQGTVQWVDMNADLKGIVLLASVGRPSETAAQRMQWVIETYYQGDPRDSTDIQYGHLIGDGTGFDNVMDATTYKANTEAISIIEECNNRAGKIFGVVIHMDPDTEDSDHKCFQWIGETNHTLYVSDLSISDVAADVDGATTFEPVWRNGTASTEDPTQVVSGIGLTYGTDDDQAVFVTDSDLSDQFDYYVGAFTFDRARTETWATARAENMLTGYGKEYTTVQPSILIPASLHNKVRAGMSISVRSDAAFGGEDQGVAQMKRISNVEFEPAGWKGEVLYLWANLQLDQPLRILTQPDPNHDMGPQPPTGNCTDVTSTFAPTDFDGESFSPNTHWYAGGTDTNPQNTGQHSGTGAILWHSLSNPWAGYHFEGTWTAGKTYTVGFWFKFTASGGAAPCTVTLGAVTGTRTFGSDKATLVISGPEADWTHHEIEWTPASTVTSDGAWDHDGVAIDFSFAPSSTDGIAFDDGTVEECSHASPPPASDDDTGDPGSTDGTCYSPCDHKHPAQIAAVTPFTPSGTISSTNVQDAIEEVAAESGVTDHGALTGLLDDDHTQYIKDSEFGAKGRILVGTGSGTFDDLPVGTNGQRLVADSSQATGVKWDNASVTTEADVRDAGRWEHAVITGSPPDDLYADGDWLYIWVSGA